MKYVYLDLKGTSSEMKVIIYWITYKVIMFSRDLIWIDKHGMPDIYTSMSTQVKSFQTEAAATCVGFIFYTKCMQGQMQQVYIYFPLYNGND